MLNPVLPRSQQIVLFSLVNHFKRPATSLQLVVTTIQHTVYWPNRPLRLNTRPCLLTGSASVPDTTLAYHAFCELSSADRSRGDASSTATYDFKQKHRRVSMETILSMKTWIIRKILSTRSAI